MLNENFEQLFKAKGMSLEWNKTALELYRQSLQQGFDLLSNNLSLLSDQLKRLSHAKNAEDLLNIQKTCLNEDITATIETVQKTMHFSMENMEELARLYGTPLREQVRETVHKAEREKERQK